jgi:hypothetical protein
VANKRKRLAKHVSEIIKTDSRATPWTQMTLCGFATCLPLAVGFFRFELVLSVYGALIGYFLALNDHPGPLKNRIAVTTLTFLIIVGGFGLGFVLHDEFILYRVGLTCLVYWLGVLAGEGAELERGFMFGAIGMVVAYSASGLLPSNGPLLLLYVTIGYFSMMVGMPILSLISDQKNEPFKRLRDSFKESWTAKKEKHIHALSYALTTLLSVWISHYYSMERGYWITVTILLVMKPDRTQALYKIVQRLLGTALAVLLVHLIIKVQGNVHEVRDPRPLIFLIVTCAFGVPWAFKRNYWLVTFLATIMVVLLLELAVPQNGDAHLSLVRLQATLWGCLFVLCGSAFSKTLDWFIFQRKSQKVVKIRAKNKKL